MHRQIQAEQTSLEPFRATCALVLLCQESEWVDANEDDVLERRIAVRVEAAAAQTGAPPAMATILTAGLAGRQGAKNLSKGELAALSRELIGAMNGHDAA